MSNDRKFQTYRYLLMTVDPVHVGTGGSRLGRVDNSIIREPGTHLPKIPGTGLSGAIRQYAAYRKGRPECAGQGKDHHKKPEDKCPVCFTFGTANDNGSGYSGMVSIGDARLLFFPVYSMQGPVWVTSPAALQDSQMTFNGNAPQEDQAIFASAIQGDHLNLGWLMVGRGGSLIELDAKIPEPVRSRLVVVSEKLFSHVVNSNLEVRTSVSINPLTGAAEDKALFTFEALPRAAYLWMDIVEDNFRNDFPQDNEQGWKSPIEVVNAGLEWAQHLGVGGMGTRGFGRLQKVQDWMVQQ